MPFPAPPTPRRFEALYIHVPFCARKCDYCAFYSLADSSAGLRQAYLERLEREFAEFAAHTATPLESVFFGGGTPTFLEFRELERLLRSVRRAFRLQPDAEISMECNPESLTAEKAAVMAAWGVNRVSLGAQSFSLPRRAALGRHGDPGRVGPAIRMLRLNGIENVGLDLIYAIPGQTLKEWEWDLRQALEFQPKHLSTYSLTIEEGSALAGKIATGNPPGNLRQPVGENDDAAALSVEMWEAAETAAGAAGLPRYEISNFARPGFECRHNLATWHGGTYLGCGPAACSFDGTLRWGNPTSLEEWLKMNGEDSGETPGTAGQPETGREVDALPPPERAIETLIFGLRTLAGWEADEFHARTGFTFAELRGAQLARLREEGLLELSTKIVRPTRRGLLFNDTIGRELL